MRSIKEQREMTIHIEHAELLDWAERARRLIIEAYGDDTSGVAADFDTLEAWKLLEELPEE